MLDLPPMQGIAFIRRCDAEDFDLRIKRGSAFIRCYDAQQSLLCNVRSGFGYTSHLRTRSMLSMLDLPLMSGTDFILCYDVKDFELKLMQ